MSKTGFVAALASLCLLTGCPGEPPIPDDIFGELGEVAPYATDVQRATFERGRAVAERQHSAADGLGPHFNLSSCTGCHERPLTGGGGPRYRNFLIVAQDVPGSAQNFLGVNGIQPQFDVVESRFATPESVTVTALRNPIPFFGAGLMAEIPGESILVNADPDDRDGDGISGRANFDQGFVGRFGRKSQTVSVEGFIRGPLFNHLGITTDPLSAERKAQLPVPSAPVDDTGRSASPLVGDVGRAVQAQASAPASPTIDDDAIPDPEMSEDDLFDLVSFAMLLAAPRPDEPTPDTMRGRELFDEMKCIGCHVHTLTSPRGAIPLYSDLLLHDMGPELADGLRMGVAEGSEFRTQPLWGIASVGPFLHDGRADTLDQAIRLHAGEGQAAREAYEAASEVDRDLVLLFLESLGGRTMQSAGLIPPDAPILPEGAIGGPVPGTDAARFERGRRLFDRDVPLDGGLGPNFNGDSCRACHFLPEVGGAGPIDVNVTRQGVVMGSSVADPATGTMAHRQARSAHRPAIDPASDFFELRQTPSLFGLGLVDQIPEAVIVANEDPTDLNGDGIRGRAHILPDGRVGRLGWKANVPNLAEFSRDAMFAEVGVTLPDQPGLTFGGASDDDGIADPEIAVEDLEDLTFYMSQLAPPPRERTDVALEDAGEALFSTVGCGSCHRSLELADGTPVHLYSDLLLHDVFEVGALGVGAGDAMGRELRTAPLWGISKSGPYMHDGRAATIEEAIARHFGEASASAMAFAALDASDREALLAFLMSL